MVVLPNSGRARVGSFALAFLLALPVPLQAQQAEEEAEAELAEEVAEEVQSLPASELPPLEGADAMEAAAPLTDFADFGVAWPDMSEVGDAVVGEAAQAAAMDAEQSYEVTITGIEDLPEVGEIRTQFDALSVLRENDDPAVVAQIDRRADEDVELLREILRSQGYYDAQVDVDLVGEAGSDEIEVVLAVDPGPLYRFGSVELPGLASAGERADELREQFPVYEEDPVDAAEVTAAEANLVAELGNRGFPFAEVGDEEVIIDHASRLGALTLPVEPGGERDFGQVRVLEGAEEIFGTEHVETIARFEPGELYSTAMMTDLQRALIQTGLISRLELEPVQSEDDPGRVDIAVRMEPAPPRTIAGQIGYGTGEGARIEGRWEHRNLLPPEGAVGVRGVLGTEEQRFGVSYRRSNFLDRDQILSVQLYAANIDRAAYQARTAGITAGFERISNQLWQKEWTWSVGTELLASDERDVILDTNTTRRRTFFIAALPLGIEYDTTNDLLNPEEGFRLGAFVSPELSLQDEVFGYARVRLDASVYYPALDSTTIAARFAVGSIPGASRDQIAPSRRFYVGGGGSVRGYAYQAIGPRDANNDPIGGRSFVEMALEARYRFGQFGIVPFIDAGALYTELYPDFSNLRFGAGLGVRYYSSFGPIRIDVGTPLNPQPGDPVVAVYVSLGQAF